MSILDRENRSVSLWGRPNKLSIFENLSVEKVAKMKNINFVVEKVETYRCRVEQTKVARLCRNMSIFDQETRKISELGRTKSKFFFVGSRKSKVTKIG